MKRKINEYRKTKTEKFKVSKAINWNDAPHPCKISNSLDFIIPGSLEFGKPNKDHSDPFKFSMSLSPKHGYELCYRKANKTYYVATRKKKDETVIPPEPEVTKRDILDPQEYKIHCIDVESLSPEEKIKYDETHKRFIEATRRHLKMPQIMTANYPELTSTVQKLFQGDDKNKTSLRAHAANRIWTKEELLRMKGATIGPFILGYDMLWDKLKKSEEKMIIDKIKHKAGIDMEESKKFSDVSEAENQMEYTFHGIHLSAGVALCVSLRETAGYMNIFRLGRYTEEELHDVPNDIVTVLNTLEKCPENTRLTEILLSKDREKLNEDWNNVLYRMRREVAYLKGSPTDINVSLNMSGVVKKFDTEFDIKSNTKAKGNDETD